MADRTPERLTRLIALVAYLRERDEVAVAELARHFAVSEEQVRQDIDLLWVSGAPGYLPDDLLDFALDDESETVALRDGQGIDRPMRLTGPETIALIAGLKSLAAVAGDDERDDVERVLARLTTAADSGPLAALDVRPPRAVDQVLLADLRRGITAARQVEIDYVTGEGVWATRAIEPWRVWSEGDVWYVAGWCHQAGAARTFRLDRIAGWRATDEPAEHERDPKAGLTSFATATAPEVRLALARESRWVADDLETLSRREGGGGELEITVRVVQPGWLRRLIFEHAGRIRVIEPPELARELREFARAALARYGEPLPLDGNDAATNPRDC